MKIIVWKLDINHWTYRWGRSEAERPAANRKVSSSTPGPAWNLSPVSKVIYSDSAPLPEKSMAFIWDW